MTKRPGILLLLAAVAAAQTSRRGSAHTDVSSDLGLRQAIEGVNYALEDSGRGTVAGANPAQQFGLEFTSRAVRVIHPHGSVTFHLLEYGYRDRLHKPALSHPANTANRVEYRRNGLTEWYVNGPQGLEQGFTLSQSLTADPESGPFLIRLAIGSRLTAVRNPVDGSLSFESAKGVVLRYGGLSALDASGHPLPSYLDWGDGEIRLSVDTRGAQYPIQIDPTWSQQQELTPSDAANSDLFGCNVSVSGDTAVVGANGKNSYHGAAYVFVRSGTTWTQQQKLLPADNASGDQFGLSVALMGDTVLIGAPFKNSGAGVVYVYTRSGSTWTQQQELTASDAANGDDFGTSVSLNADTAIIGAPTKNGYRGAAYVFTHGSTWTQQQKITAADSSANDMFGTAVAVNGDTALVSSPGKLTNQGVAYIWVRNGATWSLQQELQGALGNAGGLFGNSVSLSGDTAIFGAYNNNSSQGCAAVYVRNNGTWTFQQKLVASDGASGDFFGAAVSVNVDTAVVGAYAANNSNGAAYTFIRINGVWTQQQKLTASDGAIGDQFGRFASLVDDTTVIGAFDRNHYRGAAYVFMRPRLGADTYLFGSAAGTSSVMLAYSGSWTATANDSFLHISGGSASGAGSALVVFTYDPFTGTGSRTGTLTIAGQTVTVTQAGTNYAGPGSLTGMVSSGLSQPSAVAVSRSGNVYIADTANNAIEEWTASTQSVSPLVSSGLNQPAGVAVDSYGNVFIADTGNNAIKKWSVSSQVVSTLVSTGLNQPTGLAVDFSGNLYIADTGNNAVKKWTASTQAVSTLASGLSGPRGVTVDVAGNVYFADTGNNAVKKWTASNQLVSILISSGLSGPRGMSSDGSGSLYIADTGSNAIKKWTASALALSTLASPGLAGPRGVAVDSTLNVYVADFGNNAVDEIPYTFIGPASTTELSSSGSDALLTVLPSTTSLAGILAPTTDQDWVTIDSVTAGVVNFSFAENSGAARTAHIAVAGHTITVAQNGLTAQTINFAALPDLPFGTSFTVTATATSGLPVTLTSQTPTICTTSALLAVGQCTIQATQPGDANYSAATPVVQSFLVTAGLATPGATSLNFPNTLAGKSSAPQTVTLQNTGNAPLTISSLQATGADAANYQVAADALHPCPLSPATLAAGAVCTIDVTFAPAAPGAHNDAQLTITDNAGNVPGATQSILLKGVGIALSSITITAANSSIAYNGTEQLTATASYTDNSTVDLTNQVAWTSSLPAAATVNATGLVTGVAVGQTNITAAWNSVVSDPFRLAVIAGPAASLAVAGGSGQSAPPSSAFPFPLQALVKDSGGNPVPNASVTFSAPASGAGATFSNGLSTNTATTNSSGIATSLALTANATSGAYTVTATTPGVAAAANFSLTNQKSASLSISSSQNGAFLQGEFGATYTIMVGNAAGAGPTTGTVTVTDSLPPGLTLRSMNGGPTWDCSAAPNCTTTSVLGPGATYPAILVVVDVSATAPTPLSNQVNTSGGGSPPASATDSTSITPYSPCDVNHDWSTNVLDIQWIIDLSLTNGSGISVVDVQRIINAAAGQVCSAV